MNTISTDGLKKACNQLRWASTKGEVEAIAKAHNVQQFPSWFRGAFYNKLAAPHYSLLDIARCVIDGWNEVPLIEANQLSTFDPTRWRGLQLGQTREAWRWLRQQPRFAICNAVISIFLAEHLMADKYSAALMVCTHVHNIRIDASGTIRSLLDNVLARKLSTRSEMDWAVFYPRIIYQVLVHELTFWDSKVIANNTSNALN